MMTEATSRASAFYEGGPRVKPRPLPEPGTPRAQAATEELVRHRPTNEIIPPEQRLVVEGHSPFCRDCQKFTRCGGGCLGVKRGEDTTTPPCMLHMDGRMEDPFDVDEPGEAGLAAGQERFWRFSQIAPNVWAAIPIKPGEERA